MYVSIDNIFVRVYLLHQLLKDLHDIFLSSNVVILYSHYFILFLLLSNNSTTY